MRRHKGGYYTREDEGELGAKDPDTAVLRGVTGCKVLQGLSDRGIVLGEEGGFISLGV